MIDFAIQASRFQSEGLRNNVLTSNRIGIPELLVPFRVSSSVFFLHQLIANFCRAPMDGEERESAMVSGGRVDRRR